MRPCHEKEQKFVQLTVLQEYNVPQKRLASGSGTEGPRESMLTAFLSVAGHVAQLLLRVNFPSDPRAHHPLAEG